MRYKKRYRNLILRDFPVLDSSLFFRKKKLSSKALFLVFRNIPRRRVEIALNFYAEKSDVASFLFFLDA